MKFSVRIHLYWFLNAFLTHDAQCRRQITAPSQNGQIVLWGRLVAFDFICAANKGSNFNWKFHRLLQKVRLLNAINPHRVYLIDTHIHLWKLYSFPESWMFESCWVCIFLSSHHRPFTDYKCEHGYDSFCCVISTYLIASHQRQKTNNVRQQNWGNDLFCVCSLMQIITIIVLKSMNFAQF